MPTFVDLLPKGVGLSAREEHEQAERQFPEVVAEGAMYFWQPGNPVAAHGQRLLIGVATYSGYDLRLLDVLAEALRQPEQSPIRIDVFDVAACPSHEAFEPYIPGLGLVFQAPVVGIWHEGQFLESAQGAEARRRILQACGMDPAVEERIIRLD